MQGPSMSRAASNLLIACRGTLTNSSEVVTVRGYRRAVIACSRRVAASMTTEAVTISDRVGAPQGGLVVPPDRYPKVHRDESCVEVLHGVSVADPYRWLEDPYAPETKQFVEDQNALTAAVLAQCTTREQFKELLTSMFNYPRIGVPYKHGSRYYYSRNSGLQAQSVYYTQSSLDSESVPFLDPNTWSEDGTVSLSSLSFSEDGCYVAYSKSSGGSDWNTVHAAAVGEEGQRIDLEDKLEYVKFTSLCWTHDHKGFLYNRYPQIGAADLGTETVANRNQQLWYHVLGQDQEQDQMVMELPDEPEWMIGAEVTDDGRYLVLTVSTGCLPANRVWLVDLQQLQRTAGDGTLKFPKPVDLPLVKLVDNCDAKYSYISNEGTSFTFRTNLDAPRNRLVRCDIADGQCPPTWTDVVPQHDKDVLTGAQAMKGDALVVFWLRDVASAIELRSLSTGAIIKEIPLPGIGSVNGFSGGREDSEFFFNFTGFTDPGAIYRCDTACDDPTPLLFKRIELSVPFDPAAFVTKQVFVSSKDGTGVPMFIIHRQGIELDGSNPTLLYGYGGFNISLTPSFSVGRLSFLLAYNGVAAVANLRGGGEYGREWRDAGSVHNKQNVFDDFQAAAEFLCREGYCSPSKLTIEGGSNGGLLVAACANQRPDLYAAVIAHVGVMDMLRYHKFTIGHAWMTDYGSPDNAQDFGVLYKYSPLHNVVPPAQGSQQYPAMLLTTGDHDDRVVPLHSHKLTATLQYVMLSPDSRQRNPLIERVEVRAGHGAGKSTMQVIQEAADCYSFAAQVMEATWQHKPTNKL